MADNIFITFLFWRSRLPPRLCGLCHGACAGILALHWNGWREPLAGSPLGRQPQNNSLPSIASFVYGSALAAKLVLWMWRWINRSILADFAPLVMITMADAAFTNLVQAAQLRLCRRMNRLPKSLAGSSFRRLRDYLETHQPPGRLTSLWRTHPQLLLAFSERHLATDAIE